MGDEPANRHTGEVVQQRQHGVEHRAADVLEVNVDSTRAGGFQSLGQVGLFVIEAGVEAEFLLHVATLPLTPGDADGATSLDLGDLPNYGARSERASRRPRV